MARGLRCIMDARGLRRRALAGKTILCALLGAMGHGMQRAGWPGITILASIKRSASMRRMNFRQWSVVIGVPVMAVFLGLVLRQWLGGGAIIITAGLLSCFLAFLLIESRNFGLGLFERQVKEVRSNYVQMEALIGVHATLKPSAPLPPTRFWAASPDLLRELITHIQRHRPRRVLEVSSGTSTVVIGLCLKQLGAGRVVALEHDPHYAGITRQAIIDHGLEGIATVVDAPLKEQVVNGHSYPWYDLSALALGSPADLLVVDGPPDTIRSMARYPALPLLAGHLAKGARVLLDDGGRSDERSIAHRWAAENPGSVLEFLPLEAGAWSLRLP